jgi:hypothetical protein
MNGTEMNSFQYPRKISARLVLRNERNFLCSMAEVGNKEIERSVDVGSISGDAFDVVRESGTHLLLDCKKRKVGDRGP